MTSETRARLARIEWSRVHAIGLLKQVFLALPDAGKRDFEPLIADGVHLLCESVMDVHALGKELERAPDHEDVSLESAEHVISA